jgi:hypothetical protein
MAVVIDNMESTVEPASTSGPPAAEADGQKGRTIIDKAVREKLPVELHLMMRRQARLRAD